MFKSSKPQPPKRRVREVSQFGLFEIPDNFDSLGGIDDEHDSDLEAELAAIMSEGHKPKAKPQRKKIIPAVDLDKMVAESLRDIGCDEEVSDGDDDNDDDPLLLGELQEITGETFEEKKENIAEEPQVFLPTTSVSVIEVIKARMKMYEEALKTANSAGEDSRARRFNRGLKTLNELLKKSKLGQNVNIDEIPPEVFIKKDETDEKKSKNSPTNIVSDIPRRDQEISRTSSVTKLSQINSENIIVLKNRQKEYKVAALQAKKEGDKETVLEFLKIIKHFDVVIKSGEEGQRLDLSDMPPPPKDLKAFLEKMGEVQSRPSLNENKVESVSEILPEPKNILEALQRRLDKYKSVEESAKNEDNAGKARRYNRIVKQYEDVIKRYQSSKIVDFSELPTPPGFGPLPIEEKPKTSGPTPNIAPKSQSLKPESEMSVPTSCEKETKPSPSKEETTFRISGNQISTTLMEKQMATLLQRQKEFKTAAIEAKKSGEIEQAKEYLKIYKGFEVLLNAASGGLPVDMNSLPIPPSQRSNLEDSFAFVSEADCDPSDDISDISLRLEEQLTKQLMMCKNTRDHHRAMGDVAGMNRFENLALAVQKDLDIIRYTKKKNLPLPKFCYEQKSFNIVHCNTDLTENEVEIIVVRGISYNVPNPKTIDTYVRVEFPYPQDYPFKAKTTVVKNTDSPDYDQRYKVEIQRSNRQCQRVFKRHSVKFEIYSRGGFLQADALIGTVTVKLQPLETKCDIHESFDLMDGRKTVGGKLEIKVRVRNPILTKQIEHINEKWLVINA